MYARVCVCVCSSNEILDFSASGIPQFPSRDSTTEANGGAGEKEYKCIYV